MERPEVVKKRIDGKMHYSLKYGGKIYECKRTKNGRFFVKGYPQHEGSIVFLKKLVERGLVCDSMTEYHRAIGAYRALNSVRDSFESIYDNIDDPAGRIAVREHLYRHFIIILNDKIREQFSKI